MPPPHGTLPAGDDEASTRIDSGARRPRCGGAILERIFGERALIRRSPMRAFQKIVVATDFGPSSRRAIDAAMSIAERYRAELVMVHAVEPFIPPYPIALMPEQGTFRSAAQAELETEAERVRAVLPGARQELLTGAAADAVTRYAEESAADLIVIGTHGRRGPSRWLLGSVAEKIVRASRVPVLTVRGEE
jgi:nucleotide-binding universal stress UspA family protein